MLILRAGCWLYRPRQAMSSVLLKHRIIPRGNHAQTVSSWEKEKEMVAAVAGTPQSIELLRDLVRKQPDVPDDVYASVLPFEVDDFQLDALKSLRNERNVIVTAPTGSGKTAAAELAIAYALTRGERVFYTTPLKALSNQKFTDFCQRFGAVNVGLSTGDSGINRDAPIIVMTTEVFRNMLYDDDHLASVRGLYAVVFDEFHYMNDQQRGTVWEESVISCPAETRILALSATVANARELKGWIDSIHGATDVIESQFRPVPLEYMYASTVIDDDRYDLQFAPLFRSRDAGPGSISEAKHRARLALPTSGGTRQRARKRWLLNPILDQTDDSGLAVRKRKSRHVRLGRREAQARAAKLSAVVRTLNERDLLPAIVFVFSRSGCDLEASSLMTQLNKKRNRERSLLVSSDQAAELRRRIALWRRENPDLELDSRFEMCLEFGVASHHAGLLPQQKSLVESLFTAGLVKVCYATETLAAGINLPARSVIITSLSKRGDRGPERLTASAILQMAGRAGRRGMDELGTVVIARSKWRGEDPKLARHLLLSAVEPIRSRFRSTYGTAAALLRRHNSLITCKTLVENSFGAYVLMTTKKATKAENQDPIYQTVEAVVSALDQEFPEFDAIAAARSYQRLALRLADLEAAGRALTDHRLQKKEMAEDVQVARAVDKARTALKRSELGKLPPKRRIRALMLFDELKQLRKAKNVSPREKHKDDEDLTPQWEAFISVLGILRDFGAVQGSSLTALGSLVASLKSENELLVALCVASKPFATMASTGSTAEFAALVSTLACDVSDRKSVLLIEDDDAFFDFGSNNQPVLGPSPRVADAVTDLLMDIAAPLADAQLERGLDLNELPVRLDDRVAGVVESFAEGASWTEVTASVALDDGDLVRLFRRTTELLRSIANLDDTPQLREVVPTIGNIRSIARDAAIALDRSPVLDYIPIAPSTEDEDTVDAAADDSDDDDREEEDEVLPVVSR